jgi:uncharacterized delta-60 repeat protein
MRIRSKACLVVGAVVLSIGSSSAARAGGGDLDPTFGTNGKVVTNFTGREDVGYPMALQADGKIVVAGTAGFARFALARYNTDGSLDTSFSGDGKLTTDVTHRSDIAYGLAVQPDGKIVVGGSAGDDRIALVRYTSEGSLDTSFSGNGKLTTDLTRYGDFAWSIALQPDGKIVAAGDAGVGGPNGRMAVVRYGSDGSLDTTFGGDGIVTTDFTSHPEDGLAMLITPAGKIVVVGGNGFGLRNERFALARYKADGKLDTTFGGDGKVTTDFLPGPDVAFGVARQPDRSIVVVGGAGLGDGNPQFALGRYDTHGSLDDDFGTDGKVTTDFTPGDDDAYSVALRSDGDIVAAGQSGGPNPKFAVARYDVDGSLDASFSDNGKRKTDFTDGYDSVYTVLVRPDDSILAAGTAGFTKFALARYLPS